MSSVQLLCLFARSWSFVETTSLATRIATYSLGRPSSKANCVCAKVRTRSGPQEVAWSRWRESTHKVTTARLGLGGRLLPGRANWRPFDPAGVALIIGAGDNCLLLGGSGFHFGCCRPRTRGNLSRSQVPRLDSLGAVPIVRARLMRLYGRSMSLRSLRSGHSSGLVAGAEQAENMRPREEVSAGRCSPRLY